MHPVRLGSGDRAIVDEHRGLKIKPLAVVGELVRGDEPGAERRREVLALRRTEPDRHFPRLDVTGAPVVHQHEPGEGLVRSDHGRDLKLEVEALAAGRPADRLAGPEDRRWVGEVEGRRLVPGVGNLRTPEAEAGRDVALVGIEVANARGVRDRGEQVDVGEGEALGGSLPAGAGQPLEHRVCPEARDRVIGQQFADAHAAGCGEEADEPHGAAEPLSRSTSRRRSSGLNGLVRNRSAPASSARRSTLSPWVAVSMTIVASAVSGC